MTPTEDTDRVEQLAEYLRLHPDASAPGVIGATGADPSVWLDAVADALETDTPAEALRNAETTEPEGGSRDTNPTPEADKAGSSTPDMDTDAEDTGAWAEADFANPEPDTYPPALLEREKWMGRLAGEKLPFAPWGDADHPDGEDGKDARYKWGISDHYTDGETVALAEEDHRLGGRVFIQTESDPFAFVDGDDVRDPDTGEVHPAFVALLEQLGRTYADVSTSGSGVHAYYQGELPLAGHGQAVFDIDTEPWGANDSVPTVEIYANKHVCVTTGEHVPGTGLDVVEWDADALRSVLEANGYTDKEPITHDTDRDRPELEEYDPVAVDAEEKADDVRDVLAGVERLTPRDLPLRTRKTGTDSTGWSTWDPSYRSSESGESLHSPPDDPVFHDHKEGESFGLLGLFAAEEGILSNPWDRLEGAEWWEAVDAARDAGAPIPEFDTRADADHTAVLPPSVRDLTTAASGWDWRHAAEQDAAGTLSVDDVRERTVGALTDAYTSGDRVLVEALPTMGKSYGSIKAAADTGEEITVLTGRGHKEQYGQLKEWCEEHGLTYKVLPSFTRDCSTANGEHGEEWADTVTTWYHQGASPKAIHKFAEDVLGRPLPCQEHDGQRCPYAAKWDFDPDTDGSADAGEDVPVDVLIGHYAHAHKQKVTTGRTVVFDEFPGGAYQTVLGPELQGAVSYWLDTVDALPFDSYTDLVENRSDEERRADALLWFDEHGVEPDETHVFDDRSAHADAPLAVFSLLAGDDLGNGFETADLGDGVRATFDRSRGSVSVLQPPALEYASGVVALDGTPTKRMWELSLGERLNHREILHGGERAEYVRDALNLNLVRTTEYIKPYNSADHVNTEQDAALLEAITEEHGERPAVITTTTAEEEYAAEEVLDHVADTKHYGNVLGSNEFDDTRLGAVIGSNHYGDDYIKKWGAYAGESVERNDEKGAGLSYGGFGDAVLQHMREHDTLQAAMRFGRDGNGAVVYVHTNTLPEWVPVAGEGRVLKTWSDGMKDVLAALEDLGEATTEAVREHPAVSLSRQQVFAHLEELRDRGVLDREQDAEDGRRVVWVDDGLHRVSDHGEAELDPVELEELDDGEVRQLSRSSIYTWDFTNLSGSPGPDTSGAGSTPSTTTSDADTGGGRPPDPAD
ncbi:MULTISPECIES: hypothetical protein [Halolamina]|uniref:Bifunctional DNA primase/polymerase, N-terminal n=3 Tax=Halolamina TaxID=1075397 RepID=A0A1I5WCH3_9EURY|nr:MULTISPECIES: hypothetical protein [Halolamina]NHX37988.1 hypothetical protein [Halolamina sp. R1-12]SFQ17439.1 hypothetical protein SAMN05216277_12710 [Halolamina pelagica]